MRRARVSDVPALVALAQEAHRVHASALPAVFPPEADPALLAAELEACLAEPQHVVVVAERAARLAGYAHAEAQVSAAGPYKRAAAVLYVRAMAVTEAARRGGIGRALLSALRAEAAARALSELALDVYAFNGVARDLYLREGFVPLRERLVAPLSEVTPADRSRVEPA